MSGFLVKTVRGLGRVWKSLITATTIRLFQRSLFVWVTANATQDPLNSNVKQDALLATCVARNIQVIYLDMYNYLGSSNGSPEKTLAVQRFIGQAYINGISVYALAGNTDWTIPATQGWVATNITQKIVDYNTASLPSQRFKGFLLDVEYWLDLGQNSTDAIAGYATLVGDMQVALGLPIGCFAAAWLKDNVNSLPSVLYNVKTAQDGEHIMDFADFTVVGSYRDTAIAAIDLITAWNDYAILANRAIYAAAETSDVAPSYITFFGRTLTYMSAQLALIDVAFSSNSQYKGIAIHDYDNYSVIV